MPDFDPGPDWVDVTDDVFARLRRPAIRYIDENEHIRTWIRAEDSDA